MFYQHQPLGTIISSVLNYDQLCQSIGERKGVNTKTSTYAPCDGRAINDSELEKLTRTGPDQPDVQNHIRNTPDLRGKFLRGLNMFYSPGQILPFNPKLNGDPDGDNRMAADFQQDILLAHTHPASGYIKGSVCGSNGSHDVEEGTDKWNCDPAFGDHNVAVTINENPSGGKETRPRNIAVYFYIKINGIYAVTTTLNS